MKNIFNKFLYIPLKSCRFLYSPLKSFKAWPLRRHIALGALLLILLLGPALFFLTRHPQSAEAAWFDSSWGFRSAIQIGNSSGSTLTDFQVSVNVGTSALVGAGKMKSDCSDIRFTDQSGKLLNYWIEENNPGCNEATNNTKIWIKANSIPSSDATIYIYYGNPSATSIQDGNKVFEFFDDFSGTSLDTNKWMSNVVNNITYSITGGKIRITDATKSSSTYWIYNNTDTGSQHQAKYGITDNVVIEWKSTINDIDIPEMGQVGLGLIDSSNLILSYMAYGDGSSASLNPRRFWQYEATQSTEIAAAQETKNFKITRAGTSVNFYIDGTSKASGALTGVPTKIALAVGAYGGFEFLDYVDIDYIFTHKYSSSDPTTTLSTEEVGSGPVAYWAFDEGVGTSAYDSTVNNNDGTFGTGSSAPTWVTEDQCVSGKCLSFDGSSNYMTVGNKLNFGTTDKFTFSTWVRTADSDGYIIQKVNSDASIYYYMGVFSGKLRLKIKDANTNNPIIDSTNTINDNKWHHVVGVRNAGTNLQIYIDGLPAATYVSDTTNSTLSNAGDLEIGQRTNGGANKYPLQGFLDEPKIYPYARSAAQIKSDYNSRGSASAQGASVILGSDATPESLSNGLVGYWKMDETTGTSAVDSSGNGNSASIFGQDNFGKGKFGNGIRVGTSTANYADYGNMEAQTGWGDDGTLTSHTYDSSNPHLGSYSYHIVGNNGGYMYDYVNTNLASQQVTLTSWVRGSGTFVLRIYNSSSGYQECTTNTATATWQRYSCTKTYGATGSNLIGIKIKSDGTDINVDSMQVEINSTYTTYENGSQGTGYSWTGATNASPSVRTGSSATNATLINDTSGTIAFWFNNPALDNLNKQSPLGSLNGDSSGGIFFGIGQSGISVLHAYGTGVSASSSYLSNLSNSSWNHLAYSWDNSSRKGYLYYNGSQVATLTYSQAITIGEYLQSIGYGVRTGFSQFNGTIDDIRAYNRVLSPAEIQTLYNWAPGPVGWWKMDEKTGSTAYDSSGNNNNASFGATTAAPTWTTGKYGGGLSFNGANSYTEIPNSTSLNPTNQISIGVWIKPISGMGQYAVVVAKPIGGWTTGGYGLTRDASTDNLTFWVNTFTNKVTVPFTYNEWQYVTATYDGITMKIFKNGSLVNSKSYSTPITQGAEVLRIGKPITYNYPFKGLIDDVRIYNYARSSKQIVEDMNAGHPIGGSPIASQQLWWSFDEGYNTKTNNLGYGGTGYNGTLTCGGTSCVNPSWNTNGIFGKALYFTGIGTSTRSFVSTSPVNMDTTTGSKLTFSIWAKPESTQTADGGWLVRNGNSVDENYGLDIRSLSGNFFQVRFTCYNGTDWGIMTTTGRYVPANTWSHIVIVLSQGEWLKLYVNGIFREQVNWSGANSVSATSGFYVGGHNGTANQYFKGLLDEVKVYSSELTADEIKLDYNQGKSLVLGAISSGIGNTAPANAASQEYCIPGDSAVCTSPVAEWQMEEGSGTTLFNTSGNGNTGTFGTGVSAPTWTTGKIGKALKFDGIDDFVNITGTTASGGSYTFEFWANPGAIKGIGSDFFIDIQTGRLVLGRTSAKYQFYDNSWKDFGSGIAYSPYINSWHYYTFVFDSSITTAYLYIDGRLQGSNATYSSKNIGDTIALMSRYDNSNYQMKGYLDQFRIFNYARTPAQIAWDYNKGKPVGWWDFDECEGNIAHDMSGIGNTGTINIGLSGTQTMLGTCASVNSAAAWSNGASGKINGSLNFDGVDDYIQVPHSSNLNFSTNGFSVSSWVKTSSSSNEAIASKNDSGGSSYWFVSINGGKLNLKTKSGGSIILNNVQGNTSVNDGQWHHVTAVRNGDNNTVYWYVDGKLDKSQIEGGDYSYDNSESLRIGNNGNALDLPFTDQIDDVRIYNYSLTGEQIKTLYTGGAVRFGQ